jgi:phospholipase/carboxylesterase
VIPIPSVTPIRRSRREAIALGARALRAVVLGPLALGGCNSDAIVAPGTGQLTATPHAPSLTPTVGLNTVNVGDLLGRQAFLYVPASYSPATPAPLVVLYHGASGRGSTFITPFQSYADDLRILLLAFSSFAPTWDGVIGNFGVDTDFTAKALNATFDRCNVDAGRISAAGFSDGATYSLAMGRANGGLFTRVGAFSPGFLIDVSTDGKPEFFISHGTQDPVLSFQNTRDGIVPALRRDYAVEFREFEGGHQLPKAIADIAFPWLAGMR